MDPEDELAGALPEDKSGDAAIRARAKERYRVAMTWESNARAGFLRDTLFDNADSDNGDQWPETLREDREFNSKPCLTMNMVQVHNRIITNEMKKNKTSMQVLAAGGGASKEAADVWDQLVKRVEYQSNASLVYDTARKNLVVGGVGYWRLQTGYLPGEDWEQEVFLLPVPDPLAVLMDPGAKLPHGGDANWSFVFDKLAEEVFKNLHPKWAASSEPEGWVGGMPWRRAGRTRRWSMFASTGNERLRTWSC